MKQIKSCKTLFPISVFVLGILILTSCTTGYKNDGKEVTWHTWNEGERASFNEGECRPRDI